MEQGFTVLTYFVQPESAADVAMMYGDRNDVLKISFKKRQRKISGNVLSAFLIPTERPGLGLPSERKREANSSGLKEKLSLKWKFC